MQLEEIDMAALGPIAGSGDLFDVDFAAAGFGVRPMFTHKACLGNFSYTDEPAGSVTMAYKAYGEVYDNNMLERNETTCVVCYAIYQDFVG